MKNSELHVLALIANSHSDSDLPKSYFKTFPYREKIAKDLMWRGLIESTGAKRENVALTAAGKTELGGAWGKPERAK